MRRFLIVLLVTLLALSACSREERDSFLDTLSDEVGPRVIDALQSTYSNPALLEAYAKDGWDGVKAAGPGLLLANLKNECLDLADGDVTERRIYGWIRDNSETLALMVYDDRTLPEQGIWMRLDALAKSAGHEGASLHLVFKLTPEQIDYLVQRAPRVIVEEYERVTGQPIGESLLEGIETGGL